MLLPLLLATALHVTVADSVSGTWQVTGDVVGNPVNEICTLKLADAKITGTCRTAGAAKSYDVTGAVKDGKITFSHGGEYEGQPLTLTYTGTMASAKSLTGSIDVQPFGVSGQFTAAPAATPAPSPTAPPAPARSPEER